MKTCNCSICKILSNSKIPVQDKKRDLIESLVKVYDDRKSIKDHDGFVKEIHKALQAVGSGPNEDVDKGLQKLHTDDLKGIFGKYVEKEAGKIKGPGVPDGTGPGCENQQRIKMRVRQPGKGLECPLNEEKQDEKEAAKKENLKEDFIKLLQTQIDTKLSLAQDNIDRDYLQGARERIRDIIPLCNEAISEINRVGLSRI